MIQFQKIGGLSPEPVRTRFRLLRQLDQYGFVVFIFIDDAHREPIPSRFLGEKVFFHSKKNTPALSIFYGDCPFRTSHSFGDLIADYKSHVNSF